APPPHTGLLTVRARHAAGDVTPKPGLFRSLLGQSATRFAHPDDHAAIAAAEQGQLESADGIVRTEVRLVRPDGEIRWAWASITPTPGPNGEAWTLAIVQDVTARKAAENALRESQSDLAAIAAVARCVQAGEDPRPTVVRSVRNLSGASTVSMVELNDPDHLVVTAGAGEATVGILVPLQDVSMTARVWATGEAVFLADAADHPLINSAMLAVNGTVSALWQPVVVTGSVQALLIVTWSHRVADPGDRAVRAVRVIADEAAVSLQAKRLRAELENSASTDPLTGSLNRRAWDSRLDELVASTSIADGALTIALVDLDHFKDYNDNYGHGAGDLFLRDFATAARRALRLSDVFARWGGEEFVIALPGTTPEQNISILERIRACVPGGFTCSVGYTTWAAGESIAVTISRADAALYDAKQAGRDRLALR
ncbi:diguanylate cyclase (GGDEF)-like protein, partial [Nakamurella sp. UYEF19]|uniref:sensor domain-containing diguanylate cyclase n=1 Tax=Nakamurella sp. UYEF19 TaxID=1756392 RepID=UPI003392A362